MNDYEHKPVLLDEVINGFRLRPGGIYVDCTFGRGGHSQAILNQLGSDGRLFAFDKDPEAIHYAKELAAKDTRLEYIASSFTELSAVLSERKLCGCVDGILFDLGVSSPQLDDSERGFSFMRDGKLDMRMNPQAGISAEQWLNQATQQEIADVLYTFGEERHSRRIASAIVQAREEQPVKTTSQLAMIISQVMPRKEKNKHPATRSFQGIRIFINNELDELRVALIDAFDCLKVGGRLAVISFHSLEDRIVKKFMRSLVESDPYPKDIPIKAELLKPKLKIIGKAISPGRAEITENPRARSARLRIGEKLAA